MRKKKEFKKLELQKIEITKINNLSSIRGGNGGTNTLEGWTVPPPAGDEG